MIEDTLLVSLGCCDFFEFHPSHGDLLAADGCQPFDDVTHGPLSIFVSTVGGEEGRQSLFHMPLQVIGKRAQKHVTLDPIIGLVINRSHFELHVPSTPHSSHKAVFFHWLESASLLPAKRMRPTIMARQS